MATSFAPRTAIQRSMTPASTSPRCQSNLLGSTPAPSVLQRPATCRSAQRSKVVTQAFQGSCWDGRRGSSSRRGSWGPLLWNFNGPMAGANWEDLAREFGFAAYPGCAPNMAGGNQTQRNMRGFWKDISNAFSLPLDIEEQADQYLLTADVPGLQKADLKITVNKAERTLNISGERRRPETSEADASTEQSQKFKRRFERRMGKLNRTIPSLPDNADLESVTARVDKGVLTITIRKVPEQEVSDDSINVSID